MSKISEEEIQKILPIKGPSFDEVKNYLKKYNDEYIVIKCGVIHSYTTRIASLGAILI